MTTTIHDHCEVLKEHMQKETSFNWSANTNQNMKDSTVFRLSLEDDLSSYQFDTKEFNLTDDNAPTTTASSTSSSTDSPHSTPTTPLAMASSNSGLSQETKVGVGFGVGLRCAFLIALGAIVWYIRRWTKNVTAAAGSDVAPAPVDNTGSYKQESIPQQPQQSAPAELPGDGGVEVSAEPAPVRHELP